MKLTKSLLFAAAERLQVKHFFHDSALTSKPIVSIKIKIFCAMNSLPIIKAQIFCITGNCVNNIYIYKQMIGLI